MISCFLFWSLNKRCQNCLYYRILYFIDIYYFFKTVVAVLPDSCSEQINRSNPHIFLAANKGLSCFLLPSFYIFWTITLLTDRCPEAGAALMNQWEKMRLCQLLRSLNVFGSGEAFPATWIQLSLLGLKRWGKCIVKYMCLIPWSFASDPGSFPVDCSFSFSLGVWLRRWSMCLVF